MKSIDRLSEVVIQNDNISATQFTGSNFGKKGLATFFLSLWSPYVRIFFFGFRWKKAICWKLKGLVCIEFSIKEFLQSFIKCQIKEIEITNYKEEIFHIVKGSWFTSAICSVFFFTELTINKTKIDETGIRFPEVTSKNSTEVSDTVSTFFELGKQKRKTDKGWRWRFFRFLCSKKS